MARICKACERCLINQECAFQDSDDVESCDQKDDGE